MVALVGAGFAYQSLSSARKEPETETSISIPQDLYHIGIETGGTTCKVGIMHGSKSLKMHSHKIIETTSPAQTISKICEWLNTQDFTYSSLGVAAFGPLCLDKSSKDYGCVTSTPKVAWQYSPVLKFIMQGLLDKKKTKDFRVAFDTDCNILAQFELENGGHGAINDNIAYITVGTGIGVGFVVNGKGIHGLIHPEGGHVHVPMHPLDVEKYKFEGTCTFHGCNCVEGLCSNTAIAKRLGLGSVADVPSLPDDHEIWEILGFYLGTMCSNLTLTLSVQKIVIGGGVMNRGEVLFKQIRRTFKDNLKGYLKHETLDDLDNYIVRSKFENELGLISSAAVGASAEKWED